MKRHLETASLNRDYAETSMSSFAESAIEHRYASAIDLTISPGDDMYHGEMRHYLRVAYSGLRYVNLSLAAAGADSPRSILDLPCGFGRMLRLFRIAFPEAEITAADLNRAAVDFCASQFGATGVYSHPDPAAIPLDRHFDLLWCGSLLTHIREARWPEFLNFFRDRLEPGGVVVFTTHGALTAEWLACGQYLYGLDAPSVAQVLAQHQSSGFGYADYAPGSDYGVSLTSAAWVFDAISRIRGWRLVAAFPRAWDDHHDVWACVRT